jgi:RimJ/RimL family protein N-acetyltransferase
VFTDVVDVSRLEVGDGLVLRAPREDDLPGVLAVHGDPRVYRHDPHETQTSLEDAATFVAPFLAHWARHGFGYWIVLVPAAWWPEGVPGSGPEDGARVHAGIGGIQHYVMAGEPVLNVYFRLSPEVHGRGIAGLIVRTAQAVAPRLAPGTDLVVRTRPANAAARRVAEREGFVDLGPEPGSTDMQVLRWSPAARSAAG